MTIVGRRPREVYRVYTQDEFLEGAAQEFLDGTEQKPAGGEEPAAPSRAERRLRRLAGAAMLAGAVGTVGGLVAVHVLRGKGSAGWPGRRASVAGRSRKHLAGHPASKSERRTDRRVQATARTREDIDRHSPPARRRRYALAVAGDSSGVRLARRRGQRGIGGQSGIGGQLGVGRPRGAETRSREAPVEGGTRTAESGRPARFVAISTGGIVVRTSPAHPEFGFER